MYVTRTYLNINTHAKLKSPARTPLKGVWTLTPPDTPPPPPPPSSLPPPTRAPRPPQAPPTPPPPGHPPPPPFLCPSSHTNAGTRAPSCPPFPAQRQSVKVGSEESVCRASCPAASWKAVDFEVFRQVIAAGELLLADDALVRLHSGVGAPVSGQLVGPGEPGEKGGEPGM